MASCTKATPKWAPASLFRSLQDSSGAFQKSQNLAGIYKLLASIRSSINFKEVYRARARLLNSGTGMKKLTEDLNLASSAGNQLLNSGKPEFLTTGSICARYFLLLNCAQLKKLTDFLVGLTKIDEPQFGAPPVSIQWPLD